MKNLFAIVLFVVMTIVLSACSGNEKVVMDENPYIQEIVVEEIVVKEIEITPIVVYWP